jgi:hypothetical protein
MKELEIVLALAISFLMFSSLVSMIVEVLFRLIKARTKGLKVMLESFYVQEISRRHLFHQSNIKPQTAVPETQDNSGKSKIIKYFKNRKKDQSPASEFVTDLTKLSGNDFILSTRQFIQRFANTEYGRDIATKSKDEITILVNRATDLYDDYSQQATIKYKQKSQFYNMVIAILFAVAMNVNLFSLVSNFLSNDALTQAVVANSAQVQAQYQLQQKQLQKVLENNATETDQQAIKELNESFKNLNSALVNANAIDLPIGWGKDSLKLFDQAAFRVLPDGTEQLWITVISALFWLVSTLVTGFLIGLGGPFWFDMVKRITIVRQLAGSFVRKTEQTGDGNVEQTVVEDPVELFMQVIKANALVNKLTPVTHTLAPRGVRL